MTQPDLTKQTGRVENDSLTSDPFLCSLVDEFTQLVLQGENPSVEQFVARRPEQAETLRRLLSVARVMASLTSPSQAASSENGEPHELAARESTQIMEPEDFRVFRDDPEGSRLRGTLGDFRIIREIGRGGMGVVYEAEQISLSRQVALKILPFAAMLDERSLQRFKNEARAAASLHHANIVPVFAVGHDRGVHYYAMQYIEGQTLEAMIRDLRSSHAPTGHRQPMDRKTQPSVARETAAMAHLSTQETNLPSSYFREVAQLGIQAAEALDHAHQRGIVHRDIKPSNLILDRVKNLWIADFGLARIETETNLTMTGDALGTLRYASPEQALARRGMVDQRSDIYSLGATLYELATLQPAFAKTDRNELLCQIVEQDPRPPRSINRSIPQDLQTIILKSLEKAPQDRYVTAKDLAEDLRLFVDDKAILARRLGMHRRLLRLALRHKPILATVFVALSVILCLASWGAWEQSVQRRETSRLATAALETLAQQYGDALARRADLLAWSEALRAADRAELLVAHGPVDSDIGRRVLELGDTVQREAALARIEADDAERDTAMLKACDAAQQAGFGTYLQDGPNGPKVFISGCCDAPNLFLSAFQNYGIDLNLLSEADATRMISESRIREQLVESIISWSLAISQDDIDLCPFKEKLLEIAEAAATDVPAWHQPFVQALRGNDVPKLRTLGIAAGEGQFSVNLLVLLSRVEALSKDYNFLTPLLRVAQRTTPDNFWVNASLAETLREASPPDLDGAIRYSSVAVALQPNSRARIGLAWALEADKQIDEAIAALQEAIRRDPTDYVAHTNLGVAFAGHRRLDEAIEAFRKAVQLNPEAAFPRNNLGVALCEQGKLEESIAECREAIRLKPDYGVAFGNLGVTLYNQDRFAEAIDAFRTAILLKQDCAELRTHLGLANHRLDNLDAAISEHREAIRLKPTYAMAHNSLGLALSGKGLFGEAVTAYRESIRLDPEVWESCFNLGRELEKQGHLNEAIGQYQQVIRLNPDHAPAYYFMGNCFFYGGQKDDAILQYRKAISLEPRMISAYSNLGAVLYAQKRSNEAIEVYLEAIQLFPKDGELRMNLGIALVNEMRLDEALAAYGEAASLIPENATVYYQLGITLRQLNNTDAAISAYRESIRLKSDYAEAHCNLGLALLDVNLFTEAVQELQLGHELGSSKPQWDYPSADWVSMAEKFVTLNTRLSEFEQGHLEPASAAECLELAKFALVRKHSAFLAAQLYRDGFKQDSSLGADPNPGHRYNASCAALLTAAGSDPSTERLSNDDRSAWRSQALSWLSADLDSWRRLAEMTLDARPGIAETLAHWRVDPDLTIIREPEHFLHLPEREQEQWRQFWSSFDNLRTFLTSAD